MDGTEINQIIFLIRLSDQSQWLIRSINCTRCFFYVSMIQISSCIRAWGLPMTSGTPTFSTVFEWLRVHASDAHCCTYCIVKYVSPIISKSYIPIIQSSTISTKYITNTLIIIMVQWYQLWIMSKQREYVWIWWK